MVCRYRHQDNGFPNCVRLKRVSCGTPAIEDLIRTVGGVDVKNLGRQHDKSNGPAKYRRRFWQGENGRSIIPCVGQHSPHVCGVSLSGCSTGSGAAICTTASASSLEHSVTQPGTSVGATSAYNALKIVLDATTTITAYKNRECAQAAADDDVTVSLYTHNAGTDKPDTEVSGSASQAVSTSTFTDCTGNSVIEFALATPLTGVAAGTYWIVDKRSANLRNNIYAATSPGDRACYGSNGSTWTCVDDTAYDMELWGCQ